VLGREREWALIERSLAALPGGGVVIALEGSPGIGKTTLWQQAIGQARRLGFGVRATAPGEPDAGLAFAGLGDLLDCLPEQILRDLPAPQRRAVSLALVVDSETGSPDQGALLRGALDALRSVVAATPLLIAIDDEQWLDAPTARVLGFALPRLRDAPIGVVMTRRPATDGALWAALAADGGGERLLRQTIEPLDLAALDALLANRIGHRLPRPLVRRIHVGSGGNPLYTRPSLASSRTGPIAAEISRSRGRWPTRSRGDCTASASAPTNRCWQSPHPLRRRVIGDTGAVNPRPCPSRRTRLRRPIKDSSTVCSGRAVAKPAQAPSLGLSGRAGGG
jgi:hypothetical protein